VAAALVQSRESELGEILHRVRARAACGAEKPQPGALVGFVVLILVLFNVMYAVFRVLLAFIGGRGRGEAVAQLVHDARRRGSRRLSTRVEISSSRPGHIVPASRIIADRTARRRFDIALRLE